MKITIESAEVNEKSWQKGDRSGIIRTQDAIAENKYFRNRCRIDLGADKPYEPGVYEVDLESLIRVNQYGDLTLDRRLKLTPLKPPMMNKAA
ncbi:hypothetical protein CO615_09750 [Lysobacteraceae bacterium NML75-0749]|nr:hypothetical protein CO615_09750 [Xanthomonadaceae bacterium NML75-0749]